MVAIFTLNVFCYTEPYNEALEQGITSHTIGTMQAGKAGLADCVEVFDVGFAILIHHDAPAGVMRGRHDRDSIGRYIDAEF